jgi:ADP-heptose:LPS heptosyltransferase
MPTLLHHTGALGDFITILPALSFWRNNHPNDPITLFGRPDIGSFAKDIGCIDSIIDVTLARYAPLFNPEPLDKTEEILRPYSHAIIFSGPESSIACHCRKSGLDVFDQPPFPSDRIHIVDYHISLFVDAQAVPYQQRIPIIHAPDHALQTSNSLVPANEKFCVLHAGSGSTLKNWPFERFMQVADVLRKQGKKIVWIKGPAESSLEFPDNDRIVENPTLSVLAALLQRSEMFLGNDSGVAHLSASVGCPSIVLFGPSDPQVWSPRGDHVRIVFNNNVSCSPCHLTKHASQECGRICLSDISVEEVLSSLCSILEMR